MSRTQLSPERRKALEDKMKRCAALVTARLKDQLTPRSEDLARMYEAMSYSALAGGKRIRPFLVMLVCEALGGDRREAMTYACALEMIHTYSLIHDDMPCMDNDDLRRGRPTNHRVYGEATAMLAGDGLLTQAFILVSSDGSIPAERRTEAVRMLSEAAGCAGMIGGQHLDMAGEVNGMTYEQMVRMHSLKTGALIRCACLLGALSAGADGGTSEAFGVYGEGVGRVFQLVDDVLDETADQNRLGKPTHSDERNRKTTYLSFMPAGTALDLADVITEKAVGAIAGYDRSGELSDLAVWLAGRDF